MIDIESEDSVTRKVFGDVQTRGVITEISDDYVELLPPLPIAHPLAVLFIGMPKKVKYYYDKIKDFKFY